MDRALLVGFLILGGLDYRDRLGDCKTARSERRDVSKSEISTAQAAREIEDISTPTRHRHIGRMVVYQQSIGRILRHKYASNLPACRYIISDRQAYEMEAYA